MTDFAQSLKRVQHAFWLTLFFVAPTSAILGESTVLQNSLQIVASVLIAALPFAWVHFDSKISGVSNSRLFRVGVAAASAVFVPIYIFRSRPPRAGFKLVALFFLKLVGVLVLSIVATFVIAIAVTIAADASVAA